MEVLTRERFLSNDQKQFTVPQGLTIDEILASVEWAPSLRPWTYVTVDGQEVPEALWRSARPKEGRNLRVSLRPAGGGGGGGTGKQIGMAVAAIAIAVVAWYAAPLVVGAFLGATGTAAAAAAGGVAAAFPVATALVGAGIAIAGNLALGALVQPPRLGGALLGNSGAGGVAANESSTYSLKGSSNVMSPYGVVPRVYGRHRMTPPLAAEPYLVSSGTSQTLHMLLDFGQGPLLVEDIRIGNTPIGEYTTARWMIHPYYTSGQPLYIYLNDQATLDVNAVLVQLQDNIRAAPQAGSTIVLEFQFPGGLIEFNDQGASFQRNEHITIFAANSADPDAWYPISNFYPYALFDGEGGTNTAGQAQIASFGTYIWNRDPPGFVTSDPAALSLPTGAFFNFLGQNYTIQGIVNPAPNNSGQYLVRLDRNPEGVNFIWTHTGILPGQEGTQGTVTTYAGGTILGPLTVSFGPSPYDVEFHGQTRSPRTVSVVLQMPHEDLWRIMVRRSTPVSGSSLVSNGIVWGTFRSGRWSAPIYPKSMRTIMEIAITATEQVTGQIQGINALCTSILWDQRVGAMQVTRNPALIYQDILTGQANPRPVSWDMLDRDKILAWAWNNEALSPQGDQKNTFDMVVDFRTTIGELCQTVCSAGRAAPLMREGYYSIMEEEAARPPVQMFTNRNASGFTATRTWLDYPHAIRAKYVSENTWNQEEIFVYNDGYGAHNATKFETMEFAGLTRPWQVWRAARYFMAAAMLRRERLSLTADVENLVCQRGDVVKVAHDRLFSNIVVRARKVDSIIATHDGLIEWSTMNPPISRRSIVTDLPANTGAPTAPPVGWSLSGPGPVGVTATWGNKGISADGTPYVDLRLTSASITAGTFALYTNPTPAVDTMSGHEVNTDDIIYQYQKVALISAPAMPADAVFFLAHVPQTIYGSGGYGIPSMGTLVFSPADFDDAIHFGTGRVMVNNVQLGVIGRTAPHLRITVGPTGAPMDVTIRVGSADTVIRNPKPDVNDRLNAAGTNIIPNAEGAGASLGVMVGNGTNVLPTDWYFVTQAGWTRTVVAIRRVWGYWDIDIRFQAAAGAVNAQMAFYIGDLPPGKILSNSLYARLVASTGVLPTFNLRTQSLNSADGFLSNATSANLTLSTTVESKQVHNNINFTGVAGATRYRTMFAVTPAAGEATDVTVRFRLPTSSAGTTEAISRLPAQPDPALWYADVRNSEGYIYADSQILDAPAPDKLTFANQSMMAHMVPGDIIAIGQLSTETGEWIVDKITPGPDFTAQLELMEEATGIYVADSGPIPPYVPNNGNGIMAPLAGVRNLFLSSTLYVYTPDGFPTHEILLTWDPPAYNIREYLIYRTYLVTDPGGSPSVPFQDENIRLQIASTTTPNFRDVVDTRTLRRTGTTLVYEVMPISETGRRGLIEDVSDVFYPKLEGPPAVKFTTNVLSETTMLIWDRPDVPDLGGYQIRFLDQDYQDALGTINPAWDTMISVVDAVSPVLTSLTVHSQTGIYAIRAYDTSGNYGPISFSATKIQVLPNVDEVTRLVEGPTWAGVFDRTEIVANELRLMKDPSGNYYTEGWFYPSAAVSYPASWLFRLRGQLQSYALPSTPDPKGDWNAQLWVSIQKFAPKLDSAWFVPLTTASPLAGGPDSYIPLGTVAQTDMVGRLINWAVRLTSKRADLTPSIKKAILVVDHSERREFGNDRATGTGGLAVMFSAPFFAPPSVAITLNDGATGDRIVKTVSTTSFTIEIFNSAGTSVNRKIDWQAIGYGRGA